MPRLKFDTTINAGHVLIVIGMVISVFLAYTDLVRAIDNHEVRIGVIEEKQAQDSQVNQRILETLTKIREDIAALKAQSRLAPP